MGAKLELYGGLKERMGGDTLEVESGISIAQLIERLATDNPGASELLKNSLAAINEEVVDEEKIIGEGETLHLMPPYSGG